MVLSKQCGGGNITIYSGIITVFQRAKRSHISLQAAWVIPQSTIRPCTLVYQTDWAEIHSHVGKWARIDTATSETWLKVYGGICAGNWRRDNESCMRYVFSISTHAISITIEDWRVLRSCGQFRAVPIL